MPAAALALAKSGAAYWVRDELRHQLQGGLRAEWKLDKTVLLSHLVLVADALGVHSKVGCPPRTPYPIPSPPPSLPPPPYPPPPPSPHPHRNSFTRTLNPNPNTDLTITLI